MSEFIASKAPWLASLPAGWVPKPLRFSLACNDGGAWGTDPTGKDDIVVLRSTEQTVDGHWSIEEPAYRSLKSSEHSATCLEIGDLLVTKSSGSATHIGKTTLVDQTVASLRPGYSNFMQRLRATDDVNPKFIWYLLNSKQSKLQINLESTTSTGLTNLSGGLLGRLVFAFPPLDSQNAIVSYLDVETARIDTLIAEKEKLIASVMQLRASTIHDLLNVGLMKGPVKNCSLKHFGQFRAGSGFPISEQGVEGKPLQFFKVKDLSRADKNGYMWSTDSTIDFDTAKQLGAAVFGLGTIVFAKVGAALLLSRFRLLASPCCIDNNMMAFTVDETLCNLRFAWYQMSRLNMTDIANPGTVPSINERQVKDLKFDLPPLPEQSSIVERLDAFTGEIDKLSVHVMKEIELLSELRSTTITDAVLGRIDGRVTAYNQKELEAA